jgi:hypothetical protein
MIQEIQQAQDVGWAGFAGPQPIGVIQNRWATPLAENKDGDLV